jgi:hypothetical protein
MKFKVFISALLLVLGFAGVNLAQTTEEFQQKYGSPRAQEYLVRPGILMKVSLSEQGHINKLKIAARKQPKDPVALPNLMTREVTTEIIDEIIAIEQRGKVLNRVSFGSGATAIEGIYYENVKIYITTFRSLIGEGIISVEIKWPNLDPPSNSATAEIR